ncbi:MAG: APC family permease [Gemmatimonadota bacterium]
MATIQKQATGARSDLKRVLRVRDGLAVTVGMVIAAGILRSPGLIAGYLGKPSLIMAVWVLGGIMAALATLMLAEMSAALPEAGGKYVYARAAYGNGAGFVAGWGEIIVTRGFSGAAKAVVIAEYLTILLGRGSVPILAMGVVLAFAFVHLGGVRSSKRFQNATTILKILVLLGIAAAGLMGRGHGGGSSGAGASPTATGLLGFALAYQMVAFAYYGYEDVAKMAEEFENPGRSMPRILLGGALAVAALYLLMNLAYFGALSVQQMAGAPLVAQDAIAGVFGSTAGKVVVAAAILILLSSLNVNFFGMPRVAFALARDRLGPKLFQRVSERGTPVPGLLLASAIILVLAMSGTFETLIRFMMLVALSVDLMVLTGFFRLHNRAGLEKPFRMPGYPWLPALTIVLYAAVIVIIVATEPRLAMGAAAMVAALIIGAVFTSRRVRRLEAQVAEATTDASPGGPRSAG